MNLIDVFELNWVFERKYIEKSLKLSWTEY